MLHSFIEGFVLGIGAAVPIGAINILIMNTALKSYPNAVAIGFGALSADILYLLLILLGLTTFLNSPTIATLLGIFGSMFLLYMAYLIFKSKDKKIDTQTTNTSKKGLGKNYLKGLVLTAINPYTIAFWLSVAGYSASKDLDTTFTILGLFSAIIFWITLMPYFVHRSKHRISQKVSYWISIGSSAILVFFAVSLLFNTWF